MDVRRSIDTVLTCYVGPFTETIRDTYTDLNDTAEFSLTDTCAGYGRLPVLGTTPAWCMQLLEHTSLLEI